MRKKTTHKKNFIKIQRKSFTPPAAWKKLDTLKLCREAGITKKLREKNWLEFVGSIDTYINTRIKSALGYANYERGTIELNKNYMKNNSPREKMLQTFVHEVAHHLTNEFMEHRGHGKPWKETMVWLGYKPDRLGTIRQ